MYYIKKCTNNSREKDENYLDVYLRNRGMDPDKASYEAITGLSQNTAGDERYAKTPASPEGDENTYSKTPASNV